jgi:hypothetical protein
MKTVRALGIAVVGIGSLGAAALGCFDLAGDCVYLLTCPGGTGDGGPPPGCVPSMATGAVADTCGVFVSPMGDDGNAGTKEAPLKTITAAIGKGTAVYACAGPMPYPEALTVSKAVALYGALDCTSWVYSAATKTQLAAAADAVPLSLASTAGGTEVHDFIITAADASMLGGSSIAVLVDQADALLENVDVNAGSGAVGAAGMGQAQVMTPVTASGSAGTDDAACNLGGPIVGGGGGKNTCGTIATSGGIGGSGIADVAGGPGGGGNPMMTPTNAGAGQTSALACTAGQPGAPGSTGTAGTGARGAGEVSASGYQGPTATAGMPGTAGQGGGGGGGARECDMAMMFAGPSGGGGGAGGCPGAPGNASQSGGSSIGILSLNAKLTLTSTSITTRTGGAGGTGGDGQQGGAGGQPGNAVGNACGGGKGGQGGNGGPGGGGAGGHSVAIAIKGGTPPDLSSTTIIPGTAGAGGPGGDMDMTMQTKGDDGMACKTLDFTNPMSPACAM